jgi:hypothetical protein
VKTINPRSLAATVDIVNEAYFYGKTLKKSQREQIAQWIASRQGLPGSYARMFAPTAYDFKKGIRLFTGEKMTSGAAIGHILGEETCRTLILMKSSDSKVKNALQRATRGMMSFLNRPRRNIGHYCCGTCTGAYWRHLIVGGLNNNKRRLAAGVRLLKSYRDNEGSWRRFPFFYTLLALHEMDFPAARAEMDYAALRCEKYLKYARKDGKYSMRRHMLAQRVLEQC